jgi:hypothetical protein
MTLEQYINEFHPRIADEYKRYSTPFYYEPDALYHPITNGFGCGTEGSNKRLKIVNASYLKNGERHIKTVNVDDPSQMYSTEGSTIHTKLKRIDESIAPVGKVIPNDKRFIYILHNGIEYTILQAYWRNHKDNRLCGRIWVSKTADEENKKRPYFEFYSYFGSTWALKHVYGYDQYDEKYTIKFEVSVRQFKQIVFGSPDVKIKLSN